jgi:hypothetical protein
MDKELLAYKTQTTHRIEMLETALPDAKATERGPLVAEARGLYRHHVVRVRDFQHERLIHLLVTFFFGGLFLLSLFGVIVSIRFAADPSGPLLTGLTGALALILLITEVFYVRHYYKLENGTQALYALTVRLHVITAQTDLDKDV